MASFRDPFDDAGTPGFLRSFPLAERVVLTFFSSLGLVSASVVAVSLALGAAGAVGRGVYSCMLLLGSALLASVLLMLLPGSLSVRRQLVGAGSLVATAALVSTFSLAEMSALAFIRAATSDPYAGDAEKLTAYFAAAFILLGVLGLLSAVVRKTTKLSGAHPHLILFVAALSALVLYGQGLVLLIAVAALSLLVSAVLFAGARIL